MTSAPLPRPRPGSRPGALSVLATVAALVGGAALAPGCASNPPPRLALPTGPVAAPPRFIEDDYPRALAEARASGKPLFIDTWATWCHSCVYMRAYVFPDESVARRADRFVWLSLDIDRDANKAFLARHPVAGVPTLFVVDPRSEDVVLVRESSVDARDLLRLLDTGEAAMARAPQPGGEPDALLAEGDRADAAGDKVAARGRYREALDAGGPTWPARPRALEALSTAMFDTDDYAGCARLAEREAPSLPRDATFLALVTNGLSCAEAAGEHADDRGGDASWRRGALLKLEPLAREVLTMKGVGADDRSSTWELLVDARRRVGDGAGVRALATDWLVFLEAEAAKAGTPEQRAVFDAHRLLAALALREPARVVPALEQSERDFPDDFNPPARLAQALLELDRPADALAANQRALAKVYGPRRLRVLEQRAAIYRAMKDADDERRTLGDLLHYAAGEPPSPRVKGAVDKAERRLAELGSAGSSPK